MSYSNIRSVEINIKKNNIKDELKEIAYKNNKTCLNINIIDNVK